MLYNAGMASPEKNTSNPWNLEASGEALKVGVYAVAAEDARQRPDFRALQAVPEADVREVLLSLAASNPLDGPLVSSAVMSRSGILVKEILKGEEDQFLKKRVLTNPLLEVLYTKLAELNTAANQAHLRGGHPELEENIIVVMNVTLWQMLNGTYSESLGDQSGAEETPQNNLSWSALSKRMRRVLGIKAPLK